MPSFHPSTLADLPCLLACDTWYQSEHPERADELTKALSSGHVWHILVENVLVGYGVMTPAGLINDDFINLIIIHPDHRGQGYGTALIQYFIAMSTTPRLHISCNVSNDRMRALLPRLGFVHEGTLTGFDPADPEMFFVLRK